MALTVLSFSASRNTHHTDSEPIAALPRIEEVDLPVMIEPEQ